MRQVLFGGKKKTKTGMWGRTLFFKNVNIGKTKKGLGKLPD